MGNGVPSGIRTRPMLNGVCLVAPVVAALTGPWFYVLPLLAAALLAGGFMFVSRSRFRQAGMSLLLGSVLALVYLFIAVGAGY